MKIDKNYLVSSTLLYHVPKFGPRQGKRTTLQKQGPTVLFTTVKTGRLGSRKFWGLNRARG